MRESSSQKEDLAGRQRRARGRVRTRNEIGLHSHLKGRLAGSRGGSGKCRENCKAEWPYVLRS